MNPGKLFYVCLLLIVSVFTFPLKAEKHLFCYKYRIYDQLTYQTEGRDSMVYELNESDQQQIQHFYREETYRVNGMSENAHYLFNMVTDTMWARTNSPLKKVQEENALLNPLPIGLNNTMSMTVSGRPVHEDSLFRFTVFSLPLPEFPIEEYEDWKFQIHQDDSSGKYYTGETNIVGKGQLVACKKQDDMQLAIFLINITMISTGTFHPNNMSMKLRRECETTGTYLVYFDEIAGRMLKVISDLNIIESRYTPELSIKFKGNIKSTTRLLDTSSIVIESLFQ